MNRRILFIIYIIIITTIALAGFGVWYSRVPRAAIPLLIDTTSVPKQRQFQKIVSQKIDAVGGLAAFAEFKSIYQPANIGVQHWGAHRFGEELFVREGISGIAACDGTFGFGCYHGFIARAIAQKGPQIAGQIDSECVKQHGLYGLGCPHGIGHGLGEYFGSKRINEQLEVCGKLSWQGKLLGCTGGVFMEYHMPSTINPDQTVAGGTRPFDPKNPYDPCITVPEKYAKACYFELADWWLHVLPKANQNSQIAALCQGISEPELRRLCLVGYGKSMAEQSNYEFGQTKSNCEALTNPTSAVSCLAGASWGFFANVDKRPKAVEMCDLPDETKTAGCKAESDLLAE